MLSTLHPASGVSLRDVLPQARLFGGSDIRVTRCASDWRQCQPGDLYAAIVDARGDGHDEAFAAVERGAAAVLAERLLPIAAPTCVVADTREAYGRVCHALTGRPTAHLPTLGVAGTHGKTTVSVLLAAIFEAAGGLPGLWTSFGATDGETVRDIADRHTAWDLAQWAERVRANECTQGIVELASSGLAERRYAGLELDGVVLTNLRRGDLECHGSAVNHRQAVLRSLSRLKSGGFAVVNADDPATASVLKKLDLPVLTVALHGEAELRATIVERHPSEQTFLLHAGSDTIAVNSKLVGDHMVYSALGAAAVGLLMGIDLKTVVRGIESVAHLPGRMERIECGQPFSVFVDAARSPDQLAAALKAARKVATGRVWCVFGAEGEVRRDERPLLGRALERGADEILLTTSAPGGEPPHEIAHDVLDGFQKPGKARPMPDRARALEWALSQARPGDVVLVAGKGEHLWERSDSRLAAETELCDADFLRQRLYAAGRKEQAAAKAEWN